MNKDKKYFGIDISKDAFDVCDSNYEYYQFKNSTSGFKKLLKLLENGKGICVVNPLKIKRYIQMHLSKIKTDKSDSKMILNYAKDCDPGLWFGQSKTQQESLQLSRLLGVYTKQITQLKIKFMENRF